MSDTTPPAFEDQATCPHPAWVPFKKFVVDRERMLTRSFLYAWCPRCDQRRAGPEDEVA